MNRDVGSDSMRMWGALLRALRIAAGVSIAQLAVHVGYSKSLLVGIERGTRMPSSTLIARADAFLNAGELLVKTSPHLSRQRHHGLFAEYAEEERMARTLWVYDTHRLHDLLQTEAHARALLTTRIPTLTDDAIEAAVAELLDRQALLTRQPPCALAFIVDEHVLRRPVGGPEAHRAQLEHLLTLTRHRHLTLQLLSTAHAGHPGLDGPLTLLQTQHRTWLAHHHTPETSHLTTDPDHLAALHHRHTTLRSHALSPDATAEFLRELVGEG